MRTTWSFLLLLIPLASGCLDVPKFLGKDAKPAVEPKPVASKSVRKAAPVTADQITEGNAQARADALDEEIAQDEQALAQPTETALPKKKKP
jgi:hypothetical protein